MCSSVIHCYTELTQHATYAQRQCISFTNSLQKLRKIMLAIISEKVMTNLFSGIFKTGIRTNEDISTALHWFFSCQACNSHLDLTGEQIYYYKTRIWGTFLFLRRTSKAVLRACSSSDSQNGEHSDGMTKVVGEGNFYFSHFYVVKLVCLSN